MIDEPRIYVENYFNSNQLSAVRKYVVSNSLYRFFWAVYEGYYLFRLIDLDI